MLKFRVQPNEIHRATVQRKTGLSPSEKIIGVIFANDCIHELTWSGKSMSHSQLFTKFSLLKLSVQQSKFVKSHERSRFSD